MNRPYHDLQHLDLNVKGVGYEYASYLLRLVNSIDISSNNLWGEIPEEITNLSYLGSLSLSPNQLTGNIPEGPIPSANQFQPFNDPAMYKGNSGLCGAPLPTQCSTSDNDDPGQEEEEEEEDDDDEDIWFRI
ncbi:receptor-like protein 46 [Rosa rugosa]|uniref:receptor-like protein 46 n=1 Tax=Rosa rugosa TaxID=74645 RepID=UPI002B406D63|nr:receptor-like protein 46 [Rosa rugosa]